MKVCNSEAAPVGVVTTDQTRARERTLGGGREKWRGSRGKGETFRVIEREVWKRACGRKERERVGERSEKEEEKSERQKEKLSKRYGEVCVCV